MPKAGECWPGGDLLVIFRTIHEQDKSHPPEVKTKEGTYLTGGWATG